MGKVNIGWNPKYASKTPQPNKVPKYDEYGVLTSNTPVNSEETDSVVNMEYLDNYINGPKSIYTHEVNNINPITSLMAMNNFIQIGYENELTQHLASGEFNRRLTFDNDIYPITDIKTSDIVTIVSAKGNKLVESTFYLTNKRERLVFSDNDKYITAIDTRTDSNGNTIVGVGLNSGHFGIVVYPTSSNSDIDTKPLLINNGMTYPSLGNSFNISGNLIGLNNTPIQNILLTDNLLVLIDSTVASNGTRIGRTVAFKYKIENGEIILSHNSSTVSLGGYVVNAEIINDETQMCIGYENGEITTYELSNISQSGYSYGGGSVRTGVRLIDFKLDDQKNVYAVYEDGIVRKINSNSKVLWEYQIKADGEPTELAIDSVNSYIVVATTTGAFEIISFASHSEVINRELELKANVITLKSELEDNVMALRSGDVIEKVEVCQLNGDIELVGDVLGGATLCADNTCLMEPENASLNNDDNTAHEHKIKINTILSEDAILNNIIYKGLIGVINMEAYSSEVGGWDHIAYGEPLGNKLFVGIKSNTNEAGYTYDGRKWYSSELPQALEWTAVIYGDHIGKFVAVAKNSENFACSTDGINWNLCSSLHSNNWIDITYSIDHERFIIMDESGTTAYSSDGEYWTINSTLPDVDTSEGIFWKSLTYGNKGFVAITNSSIGAYSKDGIRWESTTLIPEDKEWTSVVYDNNCYVAICNDCTSMTEDGKTWKQYHPINDNNWEISINAINCPIIAGKNNNLLAFWTETTDGDTGFSYIDLPEESYGAGIKALAFGNNIIVGSTTRDADDMIINYVGCCSINLPDTYKSGWTYMVHAPGTYAGVQYGAGDFITAIKSDSNRSTVNNSHWAPISSMTTAEINNALNNLLSVNDAMVFKGTIGEEGTITELPEIHDAGWTYRVVTAGTYAGIKCEIGDLIICIKDGTTSDNTAWTVAQTNIDGVVSGPNSASTNNLVAFNGASGKVLKDSGISISDFKNHTHNKIVSDDNRLVISAEGSDKLSYLRFKYRAADDFSAYPSIAMNIPELGFCVYPHSKEYASMTDSEKLAYKSAPPIFLGMTLENGRNITAIHHGIVKDDNGNHAVTTAGTIGLHHSRWGRAYISVIYTDTILPRKIGYNPNDTIDSEILTEDRSKFKPIEVMYAESLGSTNCPIENIHYTNMTKASDKRLKHDINYSLKEYKKFFTGLKPVTYKLDDNKLRFGFIAQDVIENLNESNIDYKEVALINESECNVDNTFKDGKILSIDYTELPSINTAMIQDLQVENEELKEKNKELEERLKVLERIVLNK